MNLKTTICHYYIVTLKKVIKATILSDDPTPRRFDMDITSIRRRPNFDEFLRRFHVLFRCNFADRKIHVVSTYFFRCNFDGRNIHGVSTYFFRRNFDGRIIHFVCKYFFRQNFDEFDVVVGKL